MSTILIVDDVRALARQYAEDLMRLGGHEVEIATSGADGIAYFDSATADCVILDLEMPLVDGFEVLATLRHRGIDVPVIVYTGTGDYERCVRAVRLGADGFIDKNEPMERVAQEVANALERGRLRGEVRILRERNEDGSALIGSSETMEKLRQRIARLAPIPSPVLVLGPSGSGKELVAAELHRQSGRKKEAYVALNCAALPENLVESELFGHERGAFTGAERTRAGAFEAASKGTLLLDEIGDLPPYAQAKLLRVLESGTVSRLGGTKAIEVDTRVVAATHKDLEQEASEGRFREDLLFRLDVHSIHVPPLAERPGDVAELATMFLTSICERFGMRQKRFSREVLLSLERRDWRRNNVRELRNTVERLVVECEGEEIDSIAPSTASAPPRVDTTTGSFRERREAAERTIVLNALARHEGHVTHAARELSLADHASLLKIMRRLGIKRD